MDINRLDPSCAYVAFGSNLDNPQHQVLRAIDSVDALGGCTVIRRSSLYATEPVGYANQPTYINAVCSISTTLPPLELLTELLEIENKAGRIRVKQHNRPRVVDLDLLVYELTQLTSERLELPHPRMHERRFVLEPLVEISPDLIIPGRGRAANWLKQSMNQHVQKLNIA